MEEAQAIYRQGLDIHADNVALRNNLGLSLALSGKPRESVNVLLGVSGISGRLPQERGNLAFAYGLLGRDDAAESVLLTDQSFGNTQDNLEFYRHVRQQLDAGML